MVLVKWNTLVKSNSLLKCNRCNSLRLRHSKRQHSKAC
jgi:hypothetical protein